MATRSWSLSTCCSPWLLWPVIMLGPTDDHILVFFAHGFLTVCTVQPVKGKMYFFGLRKGKIITSSHYFALPQTEYRKQRSNPPKSFPVSHLQTYPFLRKGKGTKSASKAIYLSQMTDILMEKSLPLVNFTFLPACHLKPFLAFLVINVTEFYLLV